MARPRRRGRDSGDDMPVFEVDRLVGDIHVAADDQFSCVAVLLNEREDAVEKARLKRRLRA